MNLASAGWHFIGGEIAGISRPRRDPRRARIERRHSDMRGPINWFVVRIINPFDDVRLLAHSRIWKNRVRSSQIFQVSLKRTDVDGWTMRNILGNAEGVRDFFHSIQP